MRPGEREERFDLRQSPAPAAVEAGPEPVLLAGPVFVEFDEPTRLDPERAKAAEDEPLGAPSRGLRPMGVLAAAAVHLLPLLGLVTWASVPVEIPPPPIPVELVLEPPPEPPPPKPAPKPEPTPPPGPLASIDIGDPAAKKPERPARDSAASEPPQEPQIAAAQPPPKPAAKPSPPRELVSALPKPAPTPEPKLSTEPEPTPEEPRPASPARPRPKPAAARPPNPRPTVHFGQIPGPGATRNEYLAYCNAMIQQYYSLLPASLLAGRSGEAIISILVLGDGTIARISVRKSSGYPDIDSRIEQMVAAVRRFPPLPQWIQEPRTFLEFHLAFPDALLNH